MATLTDFQAEQMAIISEVWPEIVTSPVPENFFTSVQALGENILELFTSNPTWSAIAVMEFGEDVPALGFGLGNDLQRRPVAYYYFMREGQGNQLVVEAKLKALQQRIDFSTSGFATFQAIEDGRLDSGESNPVNVQLLAGARAGVLGGLLSYSPGLLVGEIRD